MDLYRLSIYAHLFLSIVLVGLGLFWFIMLVALRQKFDEAETARLLSAASKARWPHVAVPWKLRLPLPLMTWAVLVLIAISGCIIVQLNGMPTSTSWWIKMALLALVAIFQAVLTVRPAPAIIRLNMLCVLALVVVSALMIRA